MMNRDVQSLRGFACLMLVLYHVAGATPAQGLHISDGLLRLLTDALVTVRMPLFALIAGAMHGWRPGMDAAKLADKFKRLIVPMLIVGTVFALVQAWVPDANSEVRDWHLLHILPVAHYWFLESLFLVFCVMTLVEGVHGLASIKRWACVFGASIALYLIHPGQNWFGFMGMIYLLPYFLAGFALTRFGLATKALARRLAPLMMVGALAAMALWAPPQLDANRFSPAMLGIGLLLSSALWIRPVRARWLARIGDYSFAIFLFHVFFTAATRIVLNRLGVQMLELHVVLGLACGVIGPVFVHLLIVRSSLMRALLLGMYKKPAAARGPEVSASLSQA